MTLVNYRPEQENPPREGGLAFVLDGDIIRIEPGVNRNIAPDTWRRLQPHPLVEQLIRIGAIDVVEAEPELVTAVDPTTDITGLAYTVVCGLVERCHDLTLLREWMEKDQRIKVRNAIARRLRQIENGDG